LLLRLLSQLRGQRDANFEVVVVDDGSEPPATVQPSETLAPEIHLVRQANVGPARARHRGILEARGDVILLLDDDMSIGRDLVAAHARHHTETSRRAVLGYIQSDAQLARMPLFERFHALMLERFASAVAAGRRVARGADLCTGNVSFRRSDYLAVGGFDPSLTLSEDAELGIRFQKAGLELRFDQEARAAHGSDHASLRVWMRRAYRYGITDRHIGWKHADTPGANPWRFLYLMNPFARPLLLLSAFVPGAGFALARLGITISILLDSIGLERPALAGTTVVYGLEYFRGVRRAVGSFRHTLADLRDFNAQRPRTRYGNELHR